MPRMNWGRDTLYLHTYPLHGDEFAQCMRFDTIFGKKRPREIIWRGE